MLSGHDTILVVEGGAGVGKSSLLRAAAQEATEQGFGVLSAAASTYESDLQLSMVWRLCDCNENCTAKPDDVQAAQLHLYQTVMSAAEQGPVLLVIDDLHWCDQASLFCLAFLVRRMAGRPVAILASRLTGGLGADPVLMDEMLRGHDRTQRIRLGPLTFPVMQDLIRHRLGQLPSELVASITWWSGGNLFLLNEMLEALAFSERLTPIDEMVPAGIHTWLLRLLPDHLPACLPVVRAVALLGDHATPALVSTVAGVAAMETADAVQAMTDMGIMRSGERLGIQHPVVAGAITQAIPAANRGQLHLAAAEQLQRSGMSPRALVAYLLDRDATEFPCMALLLLGSVHRMQDDETHTSRLPLLRQLVAQSLPEYVWVEVLWLLGRAELDLDARQAVIRLREAHQVVTEPQRRAEIALDLSHALHALDRCAEASALLHDTADTLASTDGADETLRLRVLLQLVHIAANEPEPAVDALEVFHKFRDNSDNSSGSEAGRTADRIAVVLAGTGHGPPEIALGDAWRLLSAGTAPTLALTWLMTARAVLSTGDYRKILPYTTEWASITKQGPARQALAHSLRAELLLRLGRVHDAAAEAAAALEAIRVVGNGLRQPSVVAALPPLIDTMVERGELELVAQVLSEADLGGELPSQWHYVVLLLSRGRLRHLLGDTQGGLSDMLRCGQQLTAWAERTPYAVPWRVHAVPALLEIGDRDTARRLANEEVALTRSQGAQPHWLGVALCAKGQAVGGEEGIELLAQSVSLLERANAPLELARALGELGSALCRAGRTRDARERLKRGCALADEAGATMLSCLLEKRLREARGRVRGRVHGVDSLTATERQVARIAAAGRTNREIAGALFVTRRTVEMHLTQVYRKLQIPGRHALSTVLRDAP